MTGQVDHACRLQAAMELTSQQQTTLQALHAAHLSDMDVVRLHCQSLDQCLLVGFIGKQQQVRFGGSKLATHALKHWSSHEPIAILSC